MENKFRCFGIRRLFPEIFSIYQWIMNESPVESEEFTQVGKIQKRP